jgi:two-component system, NtrC family, sensor kinase
MGCIENAEAGSAHKFLDQLAWVYIPCILCVASVFLFVPRGMYMSKIESRDEHQTPSEVAALIMKAYQVMTSDPEECIRLAESALLISQQSSFRRGISQACMHIGLGKYHQGELASALQQYRLAEDIFVQDKDYVGLRSVYNNIGILYCQWKDYDRALEYFQKNLSLEQKSANPSLSCMILINIGNIHLWSQDHEAAEECFEKALKLAQQSSNAYAEGIAQGQLGIIHYQRDKLDQAVKCYMRAFEIQTKINDVNGLIKIHLHLADVYQKQDNLGLARENVQTAMRLARQINDKNLIATAALSLSSLCKRSGDAAEEKQNLELCLKLARKYGYRSMAANALRELAGWHEREGNYKTAIKIYWRYQEVKNILTDQYRNRTIQQIRIQMQLDEKEREMKLIRETNLVLEKKNKTIIRQQRKLEKKDAELSQWNHTLELRVQQETARRQQQEQFLIQKSKLEALGKMAAGIAHEVNQPLGMIIIGIQNLMLRLQKGSISSEYLSQKDAAFRENIERIQKIIEHVRLFSRDQQSSTEEAINVSDVLKSAITLIQTQCRDKNIELDLDCRDQGLMVLGNKYRLEQVILNLVSNAMDAIEDKFDPFESGGRIRLTGYRHKDSAVIDVEDNGCGISEKQVSHIFEPFYTTKIEARGTGLGLSICYGIISDMHGSISCSKRAPGTRMRVVLPVVLR